MSKRKISIFLVLIMMLSLLPSGGAQAKKAPKLSTKKITLKIGQKKLLKVSNYSKKVTWSISKGKSYIKLVNKKKTSVKVQAKKAGNAKVKARAGKKSFFCSVRVEANKSSEKENSNSNTSTNKEEQSQPTSKATDKPVKATNTPKPAEATDTPNITQAPTEETIVEPTAELPVKPTEETTVEPTIEATIAPTVAPTAAPTEKVIENYDGEVQLTEENSSMFTKSGKYCTVKYNDDGSVSYNSKPSAEGSEGSVYNNGCAFYLDNEKNPVNLVKSGYKYVAVKIKTRASVIFRTWSGTGFANLKNDWDNSKVNVEPSKTVTDETDSTQLLYYDISKVYENAEKAMMAGITLKSDSTDENTFLSRQAVLYSISFVKEDVLATATPIPTATPSPTATPIPSSTPKNLDYDYVKAYKINKEVELPNAKIPDYDESVGVWLDETISYKYGDKVEIYLSATDDMGFEIDDALINVEFVDTKGRLAPIKAVATTDKKATVCQEKGGIYGKDYAINRLKLSLNKGSLRLEAKDTLEVKIEKIVVTPLKEYPSTETEDLFDGKVALTEANAAGFATTGSYCTLKFNEDGTIDYDSTPSAEEATGSVYNNGCAFYIDKTNKEPVDLAEHGYQYLAIKVKTDAEFKLMTWSDPDLVDPNNFWDKEDTWGGFVKTIANEDGSKTLVYAVEDVFTDAEQACSIGFTLRSDGVDEDTFLARQATVYSIRFTKEMPEGEETEIQTATPSPSPASDNLDYKNAKTYAISREVELPNAKIRDYDESVGVWLDETIPYKYGDKVEVYLSATDNTGFEIDDALINVDFYKNYVSLAPIKAVAKTDKKATVCQEKGGIYGKDYSFAGLNLSLNKGSIRLGAKDTLTVKIEKIVVTPLKEYPSTEIKDSFDGKVALTEANAAGFATTGTYCTLKFNEDGTIDYDSTPSDEEATGSVYNNGCAFYLDKTNKEPVDLAGHGYQYLAIKVKTDAEFKLMTWSDPISIDPDNYWDKNDTWGNVVKTIANEDGSKTLVYSVEDVFTDSELACTIGFTLRSDGVDEDTFLARQATVYSIEFTKEMPEGEEFNPALDYENATVYNVNTEATITNKAWTDMQTVAFADDLEIPVKAGDQVDAVIEVKAGETVLDDLTVNVMLYADTENAWGSRYYGANVAPGAAQKLDELKAGVEMGTDITLYGFHAQVASSSKTAAANAPLTVTVKQIKVTPLKEYGITESQVFAPKLSLSADNCPEWAKSGEYCNAVRQKEKNEITLL